MEIIWSPQALSDLERIGDFIAKDDPLRAITFVDELMLSAERLSDFPESGKIMEEIPLFRQIIYEGYRLVYQIRTKKILLLTVLGPGQIIS